MCLVRTLQQQAATSPAMASRYRAMRTRLAPFESAGPPPDRPPVQELAMRLRGGRTGVTGGRQYRLALEWLHRSPDQMLLLEVADNYLGLPGWRCLEGGLRQTRKTVLFVSHDRELLARVADRVVTVEGGTAWVHGGGFVR